MSATLPEISKMSSSVSALKGYRFNATKNALSKWYQRVKTLVPGAIAAGFIFQQVSSPSFQKDLPALFSSLEKITIAIQNMLGVDFAATEEGSGKGFFIPVLSALVVAVVIMVPIHFARSILFSMRIKGAAKGFVDAMDKIAEMKQQAATCTPEESAELSERITKLYSEVVAMRRGIHGIQGPNFTVTKNGILSPFTRFELAVGKIEKGKEATSLSGKEAKSLYDKIGSRSIASSPAASLPNPTAPAAKTTVTDADVLVLLNSPDAAKREQGLQAIINGREIGHKETLELAAIALDAVAEKRAIAFCLPLSTAFSDPAKVLDALAEVGKQKPELTRKVVEAQSLVHLARGRDFIWGAALRLVEEIRQHKNLPLPLVKALADIQTKIEKDRITPDTSRANFYRALFAPGRTVLEEIAIRKTEATEQVKQLIAVFDAADRADGEGDLTQKAILFRELSGVLPQGLEIVYASTDAIKGRLTALKACEGTEGALATEALRIIEDEVRVTPKGGGGGGGGPAAGPATAAPAPGRGKTK
ncbi:MAG: hypothetical protein NT099_05650 [Candidatus Saganbacteria bacterium]|nr:hypothetical protein [Candidatus Saganbacteria bacterium]